MPASVLRALAGALIGGFLGTALVLMGMVGMAAVYLAGTGVSIDGMARGLGFYVGGFALGGALAGLIMPLADRAGGVRALAIMMMIAVMGAIVWSDQGPPWM